MECFHVYHCYGSCTWGDHSVCLDSYPTLDAAQAEADRLHRIYNGDGACIIIKGEIVATKVRED
jgi:hypothetical protein